MTHTASPAAAAASTRACYFVRFASAVHGGPVDEPVYATSPAEALAIFTAQGPAVRVLSVGAPDFREYAVEGGAVLDEQTKSETDTDDLKGTVMDITEYTIDGDDLDQLLAELAEGGYTETPAYKLTVRIYPTSQKVSFNVNDAGWVMPMGELTHTIRA